MTLARHSFLSLLPIWALLALPVAGQTPEPKPPVVPPAQDSLFQSVDFNGACALAKEQKKLLMVYWWQTQEERCAKMDAITWKNPEVRAWVTATVVAVAIEGEKHLDVSQRWRINFFPTTTFHSPDGQLIDKIAGFYAPDVFLSLAKGSLLGRAPDGEIHKPADATAEDPLAWLAYANATFGKNDLVEETVSAYIWLLDHAEAKSPGFLDQYLDLVVKRLIYASEVSPRARESVLKRRDEMRALALEGKLPDAAIRWILRYNFWLNEEEKDLELYSELADRGERQEQYRRLLFEEVLVDLVAWKRYDEVVAGGGDMVGTMHTRFEDYKKRLKAAVDAGQLTNTETLAEFEDLREGLDADTCDYYETLLAMGKGEDAEKLGEEYVTLFPTSNAYAGLMLRAGRLELKTVAKQLAERGAKAVPDSDSRKGRLARILKRVEDGTQLGHRDGDVEEEVRRGLAERKKLEEGGNKIDG